MGLEKENLIKNNKELIEKVLRLEALLKELQAVIEEKEWKLK